MSHYLTLYLFHSPPYSLGPEESPASRSAARGKHAAPQDRFYLEEDDLARQLVEIGCRKGEVSPRFLSYFLVCLSPS